MSEGRKLDPTILREYDIRGIVGKTLSADDVRAAARAFGTLCVRGGGTTAAVGYDGRTTSPEMEEAAVDGLTSCGLKVYRVGRGPTPMLYYAATEFEADAGLMITGSHNPPEHNGMKMMLFGKSFYGSDIQELGRIAEAGDFAAADGGQVIDRPVLEDYVARLAADFRGGGKDLTVAWDAGNGAAAEAMTMLTDKLPGRHVLLFDTIDGRFPNHHPDPTVEKNLADLKDAVAREGCDVGIAFDGDGDRIGIVDSQGRVLWGDQIMVILASDVLAERPGSTIIADVKASQLFFDEVTRMGGDALMWRTGHSLIKSKMKESGAPLAGEMSGHIFFADRYYGFDDALYAAVRLLSILSRSEKSIAEMRDAMPQMINTPEVRFECPDERKFAVIDEVKQRLASDAQADVNDVDGVRVTTADGWWLLRASNTQAVLVARCEARSTDGLERLKAALADQLAKSGLDVPDFG